MKERTDIKDVTFLIPVRIDSVVRLENLLMVVDFITRNFQTHIHILEAASYNNNLLKRLLPDCVRNTFIEDYDPVFHRTKYINMLVENCNTPYVGVWDADIIVPVEQILKAVEWIRKKKSDFALPYKDKALDTTKILRELYFKTRDIKLLKENQGKMTEIYLPNPVGGGFFANKKAYADAGMENENFYGWGREDGERIIRWQILRYRYQRVSGLLFHLSHERGINSRFHSPKQDVIKTSEVFRIYAMSRNELLEEVKAWQE